MVGHSGFDLLPKSHGWPPSAHDTCGRTALAKGSSMIILAIIRQFIAAASQACMPGRSSAGHHQPWLGSCPTAILIPSHAAHIAAAW
jgi:hypothetical protein